MCYWKTKLRGESLHESNTNTHRSLTYLLPPYLSLSIYLAWAFHPILTGYIGEFEILDDHRNGKIVIELIGRINKCGVISPRFDLGYADVEKWVVNVLPSRGFGHIVLTTTFGIMDHEEARRKKTGGKILGFFY